jgi:hypothetical protein
MFGQMFRSCRWKAKFRANDHGLTGETPFSGFPDNGTSGDLPKSKYRIYFNDLDGSYLMIPNQE